eukprot:scaffold72193_cov33-Tisochrysis_lutea.AAC.1
MSPARAIRSPVNAKAPVPDMRLPPAALSLISLPHVPPPSPSPHAAVSYVHQPPPQPHPDISIPFPRAPVSSRAFKQMLSGFVALA